MNAPKNKYSPYAKVSEYKLLKMLRSFASDQTASETARRVHLSVRTVNEHFIKFRVLVYVQVWEDEMAFGNSGYRIKSFLLAAPDRQSDDMDYGGDPFFKMNADSKSGLRALQDYKIMRSEIINEIAYEWGRRIRTRGLRNDPFQEHLHMIEVFARKSTNRVSRPGWFEAMKPLWSKLNQATSKSSRTRIEEEIELTNGLYDQEIDGSEAFYSEMRQLLLKLSSTKNLP